jgi:hypothetical protein
MSKTVNLDIDQGTNWSTTLVIQEANGQPVNLTGFFGESQIRKHPTSNAATSMVVSLGGNTGQITLSVTPGLTSNLAPGRYVYDVRLTSNTGSVSRPVSGDVFIIPAVTA